MRVDLHMRSSFTYLGPHSHAERTGIRMRNARESHVERTRIACTGLGHEHASMDVIENHLTTNSLISDYISNQLYLTFALYLSKNAV